MFIQNQVIGHRGAAAYAPENTLTAFNKAVALGCRVIEFDVMLSKDGEAFVFHDNNLMRTSNGSGDFGLVSADYLKSLDAGSWFSKQFHGEKIPTFGEVLAWMAHHDVNANIEIKPYPGATEQTTIKVISEIHRHWPKEKELPLISSFDRDALTLCHHVVPEMPLGLLLAKWQENWLQLARELDCFSVHLNKRDATHTRINEIKAQGFKVCVYTVNNKRQAYKLFNYGVDAVFSDRPDLLTRVSWVSRVLKKLILSEKSLTWPR